MKDSKERFLTLALAIMGSPQMAVAGPQCAQALVGRTIKAVGYRESLPVTNPESLQDLQVSAPKPKPFDVIVRVEAVSVNPVDFKQRRRQSSTDGEPVILGWDAAGVIEEVGSEVTDLKVGDRVFYAGSIKRPGANSELHAVDGRLVAKMPNSLTFSEAAAIPLTALTAYEALYDQLRVKQGQSILIIGGAGGVGSIAIQLAKLAGLQVITTASRPETFAWAKQMGADYVLNHKEPLLSQMQSLGLSEVDAIFNTVDTEAYWAQMAELIKPFGRIVSIVESPRPLDLTLLMRKSVTFSWELMFTRSMYQTSDMSEQSKILEKIAQRIDEGKLKATKARELGTINAHNLRRAHEILESGQSIGKIVLSGW
jgi:NADPH2:quinone reductase